MARADQMPHASSCSARWTPRAPNTTSCARGCASWASTSCSSMPGSLDDRRRPDIGPRRGRRGGGRRRGRRSPRRRPGRRGGRWRAGRPRSSGGSTARGASTASSRSAAAAAARSPTRDAGAAHRRAQADGLDGGLGRHPAVRRRSDVTMMYPVVDIAGINRLSAQILANAAAAIAGHGAGASRRPSSRDDTAARRRDDVRRHDAVRRRAARERLEELGYEVLVFHATGTGGRAMEALIRDGFIDGVARRHDDRARRRARRRRPLRRPRAAGGGRASSGSRRSSRSARSTWSTSGRWTRCPSGSASATSTATTRPSR